MSAGTIERVVPGGDGDADRGIADAEMYAHGIDVYGEPDVDPEPLEGAKGFEVRETGFTFQRPRTVLEAINNRGRQRRFAYPAGYLVVHHPTPPIYPG